MISNSGTFNEQMDQTKDYKKFVRAQRKYLICLL